MTFFEVSTFVKTRNAEGGYVFTPVAFTDISIAWKSGGGSTLESTSGRTNESGVASLTTPPNFWQLGLPTGAEGVITASNGSRRGSATVQVDWLGNPSPKRIPIAMSGDAEGAIKDVATKAANAAKNAGILLVIGIAALGVLVWGIRGAIRR
jgi:hypothetical protein